MSVLHSRGSESTSLAKRLIYYISTTANALAKSEKCIGFNSQQQFNFILTFKTIQ